MSSVSFGCGCSLAVNRTEQRGFMQFVVYVYVREHPKAQPAMALILKRLRRRGNGLWSHSTYYLSCFFFLISGKCSCIRICNMNKKIINCSRVFGMSAGRHCFDWMHVVSFRSVQSITLCFVL